MRKLKFMQISDEKVNKIEIKLILPLKNNKWIVELTFNENEFKDVVKIMEGCK